MNGRGRRKGERENYVDEGAGVVEGGFLSDLIHDLPFGVGGCVVEIHGGGGLMWMSGRVKEMGYQSQR